MLFICTILQKFLLTFDPLDSGFITHELCINLTSKYSLKEVRKVMTKEFFIKYMEKDIETK